MWHALFENNRIAIVLQEQKASGAMAKDDPTQVTYESWLDIKEIKMVMSNLRASVSEDVLKRFNDRFNVGTCGKEDFDGWCAWCIEFYKRYYDHNNCLPYDFVLEMDKNKWNKATLEMLLDLNDSNVIESSNASGSVSTATGMLCSSS